MSAINGLPVAMPQIGQPKAQLPASALREVEAQHLLWQARQNLVQAAQTPQRAAHPGAHIAVVLLYACMASGRAITLGAPRARAVHQATLQQVR
jgi:hypothetical protein